MARDKAYRQAEKQVEKTRRSGATILSLMDMNLTQLPESLGQLTQLQALNLSGNSLTELPKWLVRLTELRELRFDRNPIKALPEWLNQFVQLRSLVFNDQVKTLPDLLIASQDQNALNLLLANGVKIYRMRWDSKQRCIFLHLVIPINGIPEEISQLDGLEELYISANSPNQRSIADPLLRLKNLRRLTMEHLELEIIPPEISQLTKLESLSLQYNQISDLPLSLVDLRHLRTLYLTRNPLNPELAAAYEAGIDAVKRYLRAKAGAHIVLNEAKLILIGEGEVGKSCLLDALRDQPWAEHDSTHGIQIESVRVIHPVVGTEITLNAWDFGGQRVYRPTHQLFFSAPAVYLVVWKPREGPQQGFVKEWIKLVKHREPDAKILVVATHGGPGQRQPDVDRQEIWDSFGRDTVEDFFLVDSKPDGNGARLGIAELKDAIARVAAGLPEMGRTVPARWQQVREALKQTDEPYLSLERVLEICGEHKMDGEEARLFVSISHQLGHLIHYEHDPTLRDIVVLKPDWLATAISFVLDDKETRGAHGLVSFARLSQLWDDPARPEAFHYDARLHPIFLRLMERFDLSYKVALPSDVADEVGFWQRIGNALTRRKPSPELSQLRYTSLIAQLVPDVRPEQDLNNAWLTYPADGDEQQVQICQIVDARSGQSATAEGLFYQLIVRLHKFSLGRSNYNNSVHWQRGLVLDYDYNGRALLEHIGNDVRITARAPSPVAFLSILTYEVKWLVENFWEGLRCEVVVPCVEPCGKNQPGRGVFEVQKLIAFKRQGMALFPCWVSGCNQAQAIDCLLQNAPAARRTSIEQLITQGFDQMRTRLDGVREQLSQQGRDTAEGFQMLDQNDRRIMSQVEDAFRGLMQALTDEAKEGPRLFSIQPVDQGFLNLPQWISKKFHLTLWCEHSRLPLPMLNGNKDKRGVYEIEVPRDWFIKAAPFLKLLTSTLSLVLPVASSTVKLALDDAAYKRIEQELDLAQKTIDSVSKGLDNAKSFLKQTAPDGEHDEAARAQGAILRQLQVWLKEKDPSFGGLVRVQNKRHEFLWVHPQFEKEY